MDVLPNQDPALELGLVAVATGGRPGGVTCQLDAGQEGAEPVAMLLGTDRDATARCGADG